MNSVFKSCTKCGEPKKKTEFSKHKSGTDGLNPRCKNCISIYGKEHHICVRHVLSRQRKKRRIILKNYTSSLKVGSCIDCGGNYISEAMHFDHRPGEKKIRSISQLIDRVVSLETIKTEISKCDLVCVGCHRLRTAFRIEKKLVYSCSLHRVFDPKCRNCDRRERTRKRITDRRALVDTFKLGPCIDCGLIFKPVLMDLDHCYDKELDLSTACGSSWSEEKILNEIKKCELVCCWCHVSRTIDRRMVAA